VPGIDTSVRRTLPPSASGEIVFGSKNHERRSAFWLQSPSFAASGGLSVIWLGTKDIVQ
jgi:hypothetical protein